jgi:hypothetical protein
MMRWIGMVLVAALMGAPVASKPEGARYGSTTRSATQVGATRFAYVDVYVDPKGEALGAYQLEFTSETRHMRIAGIEGGEHPAFGKQPPYYDVAAIQQDRVILAAFSLDADLPKGRTRVARIHLMIEGEKPQYVLKLRVAADAHGKAIAGAVISLSEGASQ